MGTTTAVYRELSKNILIQLPIRKSYQLGRAVAPVAGIGPKLGYGDDDLYLFGWPSPRFAAPNSSFRWIGQWRGDRAGKPE